MADSIQPYRKPKKMEHVIEKLCCSFSSLHILIWIVAYRRVQSWRYVSGVCLEMRLRNVLDGLSISIGKRTKLLIVYALMSLGGLSVPIRLFNACQKHLYSVAKAFR